MYSCLHYTYTFYDNMYAILKSVLKYSLFIETIRKFKIRVTPNEWWHLVECSILLSMDNNGYIYMSIWRLCNINTYKRIYIFHILKIVLYKQCKPSMTSHKSRGSGLYTLCWDLKLLFTCDTHLYISHNIYPRSAVLELTT